MFLFFRYRKKTTKKSTENDQSEKSDNNITADFSDVENNHTSDTSSALPPTDPEVEDIKLGKVNVVDLFHSFLSNNFLIMDHSFLLLIFAYLLRHFSCIHNTNLVTPAVITDWFIHLIRSYCVPIVGLPMH